ncbi:Uncharacterised protein [Mycobacteroides abscessus subsp. abscessus]|nr:Uncharacterised protein [Mycobacteroides abscessus subsp. abscessus]
MDASSKPQEMASSLDGDALTPTMTGPSAGVPDSRMTTTGLCPFAVSATDTDPAIIPVKRPRPVDPTTVSSAFRERPMSVGIGCAFTSVVATSSLGCSATTWSLA